jgi:Protein of unknown function (DUF1501)
MFDSLPLPSRRKFLKTASSGFGYLAFAGLSTWASEKNNPLAPKAPHFPARAKRVIFLCMEGAPSHVDTFDYKPKLTADDGKTFGKGRVAASAKLLGSPWKFARHGQSGLWVSELFPNVAKHADKLCIVNSMHTDQPNHPQAFVQMHTGIFQFPRPSLGAWTLYGLGTENDNLPGFVTLNPPFNNGGPINYGSCFLPSICQGTRIGALGRPGGDGSVANLTPAKSTASAQRVQLEYLQELNRTAHEHDPDHPGIEGVIESYEMAFRMQGELPKVLDFSNESSATRALYGIGDRATENFGRQCLIARRLVEAGVRFVELTQGGWDHHRNLRDGLSRNCTAIDKPIGGLLTDLHSRGLLKDTLVIWGGEFGRTPYAQNTDGRDHNARGYSIWMAGGGVKAGQAFGQTDEYGYEAVGDKVHIHDWHGTLLHLLGLDHEKLTYRHAGRDMRLTDVKGSVVKGLVG